MFSGVYKETSSMNWVEYAKNLIFLKFGTTQNQPQRVGISKIEIFVFQNLDIFNFKLLLKMQKAFE